MRADVILSEDTTTLYVRWEVVVESGEADRLARLRGPLTLRLASSAYVDDGGRFHEHVDVDVLIHPHAGRRNRGRRSSATRKPAVGSSRTCRRA